MNNPIISLIIILLSFYTLFRISSRFFVDTLERISQKYKLSSDITGATLMAAGSSSPELFIVIFALLIGGNHQSIGTGTIVGSALFNILVICGMVALTGKIKLRWQPLLRDVFFYSISIILLISSIQDGTINFTESAILILIYFVYLFAIIKWKKILPYRNIKVDFTPENQPKSKFPLFISSFTYPIDQLLDWIFRYPKKVFVNLFFSILSIALCSFFLVEASISISRFFQIPEAIIALTILAIGTSLPDLFSSIAAARHGNGSMAISNAIGSNTFNILLGLGLPWLIATAIVGQPLTISNESIYSTIVLLFSSVSFTFFILWLQDWKINNKAGYALIAIYIVYLIWEISKII